MGGVIFSVDLAHARICNVENDWVRTTYCHCTIVKVADMNGEWIAACNIIAEQVR